MPAASPGPARWERLPDDAAVPGHSRTPDGLDDRKEARAWTPTTTPRPCCSSWRNPAAGGPVETMLLARLVLAVDQLTIMTTAMPDRATVDQLTEALRAAVPRPSGY